MRIRVLMVLGCLMVITLGIGGVTLWYAHHMNALFTSVIDRDFAACHAAQELENALAMQKGYLTYFYLDLNDEWLRKLEEYDQKFLRTIHHARESTVQGEGADLLARLAGEYQQLAAARAHVINLYQTGKREQGSLLHQDVRQRFWTILNLCSELKKVKDTHIQQAGAWSRARAEWVQTVTWTIIVCACAAGLLLAYILFFQILGPIQNLAKADGASHADDEHNEITALSRRMSSLVSDAGRKQIELERSQAHLFHAGKLALVGKFAAGMAHSVRNPLTSVKMRLFSLKRSLDLTPSQKEDFAVISDEIRHIDDMVQSFLEFSRPAKLKMQSISPSEVVDLVLELSKHRLRSHGVTVDLRRRQTLPEVLADPEQFKEVLANVIVNACEAMKNGGTIAIEEDVIRDSDGNAFVVVRIGDSGPGIPPDAQGKIFQPFFTTKDEGTGLGLSIASRIMEDHNGCIELVPGDARSGATFMIALPLKRGKHEHHLDRG